MVTNVCVAGNIPLVLKKLISNKLLFQMIQMIMTVWYLCAQDAKRLLAVVEKNGKWKFVWGCKKMRICILYTRIFEKAR
jgi:hypothetical protein